MQPDHLDRMYALQHAAAAELSCSAHDLDHVRRVCALCLRLAEGYPHADREVLLAAAWLHDIARRREDTDPDGKIDHAALGAEMAVPILEGLGYGAEFIARVQHCISTHRFRTCRRPQTIEAQILSDADKLDAVGAVGLGRLFMLAGQYRETLYSGEDPARYRAENLDGDGRIIDNSRHSADLEYEIKLKTIAERLHTPEAVALARGRTVFMEEFFHRLRDEIAGRG